MRVRQQDIARMAKVSQATVSRVLSGDDKVEEAIRARVQKVMKQLNYRPDVRAQALRTRTTGLIGLVVKRAAGGLATDPFFAALTAEITEFLAGRPYHLCLDIACDQSSQESIYDDMLRTRRVDGLILVEPEAKDVRIQKLQEDDFPFVLIGNPVGVEGIWSVDNDNCYAGEIATEHLIQNGYRRVGMIAGPRGITVSEDRIAGYRKAIAGAGQEPLIWHSDFGAEAASKEALLALNSSEPPDALVVLDDFMAMGVVQAARSCGLRIPHDVGVVGFNDSNLCDLVDHGLTSVSLHIREIVRIACENLLQVVEGQDLTPRRTIVPCELMVRGSSKRELEVAR